MTANVLYKNAHITNNDRDYMELRLASDTARDLLPKPIRQSIWFSSSTANLMWYLDNYNDTLRVLWRASARVLDQ